MLVPPAAATVVIAEGGIGGIPRSGVSGDEVDDPEPATSELPNGNSGEPVEDPLPMPPSVRLGVDG